MAVWMQFAIVCALVGLGGFVDAIAGGGGLITLPAYLLVGIPPHLALGTNKMSAICGSAASTARFAKNGFISLKKVIWYIPAALAGSAIGANLALLIDEDLIRKLMVAALPVIAFLVLRDKNLGNDAEAGTVPEKTVFRIALAAAFFIGMYDGFYGPGTGTFLLLIFTGIAKMTLRESAGTTKAINFSSNAAALATFLVNGKIWFALGLTAGVFSIIGNYLGAGLVMHNGQKIVRPLVLTVLALLFIKVLTGN